MDFVTILTGVVHSGLASMDLMVRVAHGSVLDCRLHTIQIFFTMVGVAMGFFSVMLLVFGFLATGATRQNIYSGTKCIMGGRVSAAFVSFVPNFRAFCSTLSSNRKTQWRYI